MVDKDWIRKFAPEDLEGDTPAGASDDSSRKTHQLTASYHIDKEDLNEEEWWEQICKICDAESPPRDDE